MTPRPAPARPAPPLGAGVHTSPRLALRKGEAAAALGISDESFDRYVVPSVRVVRRGALRLYPVAELERWLAEQAELPGGVDATG